MSKKKMTKWLYFADDDIASQQLLDRIHCYYFHTFDIGYKLRKCEKQNIIDTEKKSNEEYHRIISSTILSKRRMYGHSDALNAIKAKTNKFKNVKKYNFGYRFYYWKPYENYTGFNDPAYPQTNINSTMPFQHSNFSPLKFWHIQNKFPNIKLELLHNPICVIDLTQWQEVSNKATIHSKTKKLKSTMCHFAKLKAEWYEMKDGETMTTNHVIGMMIYCNFDILQNRFTETYREINETETPQDIMDRHSNYYWLGRYLRECVECFGMKQEAGFTRLYHGVNDTFTFESTMANIKCPFSTSTSYLVAAGFCDNQGLILELSMSTFQWGFTGNDNQSSVQCCEMRYISDYPAENEIFCVGGLHSFRFMTIIEPTGNDYQMYMKALHQLTMCMNLEGNPLAHSFVSPSAYGVIPNAASKTQNQLNFILLSHQIWKRYPEYSDAYQSKIVPAYFDRLMDLQFENIKYIQFLENKKKVFDYFFRIENGWINLDVLLKVLPNVSIIRFFAMDNDISFLTDPLIYASVLSIGQSNIETIQIHTKSKFYGQLENYLEEYQQRFGDAGWKIYVQQASSLNDVADRSPIFKEYMQRYKPTMSHRLVREAFKRFFGAYGHSMDFNTTGMTIVIDKM
eukprot:165102_1